LFSAYSWHTFEYVTVNTSSSSLSQEAPFLSYVPQGTGLGPLFFHIFINNITENISSPIHLFADDCLIYREIRSPSDCRLLQKDLDTLVKWSNTWGMLYNIKKCNVISITNATKKQDPPSVHSWIMSLSTPLTRVYLGVTVNSKLRCNQHIDQISAVANRMLGFLRRTLYRYLQHLKEKTYKAIVHPKLKHCSSIWDPHQQKYIDKLEMIQRRAAWLVKNIPFRRSKPPVSVLHGRLTMMYKITNRLVEVPQEYHPVPRPPNSARGHARQFQRFQPTVDAFKYAFLPRTIPDWNALPQAVAEVDSFDIFKRHMSRHQQFWSSASCTMYIVHTCSTAHLFISGFNLRTCFCRCWSPWPRSCQ